MKLFVRGKEGNVIRLGLQAAPVHWTEEMSVEDLQRELKYFQEDIVRAEVALRAVQELEPRGAIYFEFVRPIEQGLIDYRAGCQWLTRQIKSKLQEREGT